MGCSGGHRWVVAEDSGAWILPFLVAELVDDSADQKLLRHAALVGSYVDVWGEVERFWGGCY